MRIYMAADVQAVFEHATNPPGHVEIRPIEHQDIPALADVYRRAYDSVPATMLDAIAEMQSAFDGSWGELWPDASPSAWIADRLVAATQTVRRPSWAAAPEYPWIIEIFTDPRHRRAGFARALVATACRVIAAAGEGRVGLTVDEDNGPAVALYRSLGFTPTM